MKQQFGILALGLTIAACGPAPTQVYFEQPTNSALSGVWSGTEEITTDNDITSNVNYPGTTSGGGASFPVVLSFDGHGAFTLFVANYPASYNNDGDRTCTGAYTRSSDVLQLLPGYQCRALPMFKYVIGRTLPSGMTLEARTNTSGDPMAEYASVHVRFNLQRE